MANKVEKIIEYAKSKLGSNAYNGFCQKFVRECYEAAGLYDSGSTPTAADAYKKWCIGKTKSDIPMGAAVYFSGIDPTVGHVAIYAGNGYIYNPVETVKYVKISAISGFLGWGWQTGNKPEGASEVTENKTSSKNTTTQKDITESVIKSVSGADGEKRTYVDTTAYDTDSLYEIYIQNYNGLFKPIVKDEAVLTSSRSGSPSSFSFTVVKDSVIDFQEGNTVIFKVGGKGVFYGYVFSKKRDKEHNIEVTAYDQLRYFKNRETYMYKNKRADQLLSMICEDFKLNTGVMANTGYVIESRIEDTQTLFDIMENAIQLTFENTGARYILYDDFGKIRISSTKDLILDLLINENAAQNIEYTTTIDSNVYTQVEIYKDNSETGQREKYIARDSSGITSYGVLQKTDKCSDDEIPKEKAESELNNYKTKQRKLTVKDAFGDIRVRGGSQVMISLNLGDIIQNAYMMVDSVTHTFKKDEHLMTLKLIRSGQFVS